MESEITKFLYVFIPVAAVMTSLVMFECWVDSTVGYEKLNYPYEFPR
jgi:hypothetical protein